MDFEHIRANWNESTPDECHKAILERLGWKYGQRGTETTWKEWFPPKTPPDGLHCYWATSTMHPLDHNLAAEAWKSLTVGQIVAMALDVTPLEHIRAILTALDKTSPHGQEEK